MGLEKQSSDDGGSYVTGFLQLFDWNAKSRKKLFSSKSNLPEKLKQKKRAVGNLPMTGFNLMDEDEVVAGSSIKGSGEYSFASSVTDDEGFGTRAPGAVARLMGLDSLPTSNLGKPFSAPFFDSQSLRDGYYHRRRNIEFHHDLQTTHSGNLHSKVEVPIQKAMEPRPQKMVHRPIEKFQTETLPPKSVKSIPITHHKLLSPIKSPGFITPKSATHIMEAASKIIEPEPQATTKGKMPLLGTSSVPLKVRDLKEKVEAAHKMPMLGTSSVPLKVGDLKKKVEAAQKSSRPAEASSSRMPVESHAAKFLRGQSMNKSWNGSVDTTSLRVSSDSEDCSRTKNKGRSISLALQAKANVQRREGLSRSGNRSLFRQKEQGEAVSSQTFKIQPNCQKSSHAHNASSVLRQNNQKQNCLNDKEKFPSKSSLSSSQGRKILPGDSSIRQQKNSSKIGGNSKLTSRKLAAGTEVTDSKKEVLYSCSKNISCKKRSIDRNCHVDKNFATHSISVDKTAKPVQSSSVEDRHITWAEDSKRKGIDVVSFTFTAPLSRSAHACEILGQISDYRGKKVLHSSDGTNGTKLSSREYNVKGSDDLSILLEQKLRELNHVVESSCYKTGMADNVALIFQDLRNPKAVSAMPMSHDKGSQDGMQNDKFGGYYSSNVSSTESLGLMTKHKLQVMEEMDECSSDDTELRKLLRCQHMSPISVLEQSFLTESCSSDTADSNSTEGSKLPCLSVQAQEVIGTSSLKKFHLLEADAELSDSASSTSTRSIARRNQTRSELEYVREILFNEELMFKDFALGRAREIINPYLFDQLESRKEVLDESEGEGPKLRQKVLFDCVAEWMDLRCGHYASGGWRTWARGMSTLRRKEWLAEAVFKEISGWRGMGDCMVDDLVDKDMSTHYGKWLDFEVEAFELGVEVDGQILDYLMDELVADILVS